jgi:hypothetical protein
LPALDCRVDHGDVHELPDRQLELLDEPGVTGKFLGHFCFLKDAW